jgi:hypothetical protein
MLMNACPICGTLLSRPARPAGDGLEIECLNCSPCVLTGSALKVLELGYAPIERARISHGLFGRSRSPVTSHTLDDLSSTVQLPGAGDLVDNLLLCVADETGGPGGSVDIGAISWRARIGAQEVDGVIWAIEQCSALQYLQGTPARTLDAKEFQLLNAQIQLAGWQRVDELKRRAKDSKKAFIAMKFGDPSLDRMLREHWVPAVAMTGFRLRRLDDEPKAGLIDDRLRLEIRTSRFLLAELTHANAGAYWEAGYAEGLGRPVIYLCRRDVFENPATRPHFDTNHHLTVAWDPGSPAVASDQLKAIIRVTLPAEAILEDGPS